MSDTIENLASDLSGELEEMQMLTDQLEDKVAGRAEVDLEGLLADLKAVHRNIGATVRKLEGRAA